MRRSTVLLGAMLLRACGLAAAEGPEPPGGLTGTVYVQGDSTQMPWVPLLNAVVLIEAIPTDTLPVSEATLTVSDGGLSPRVQVMNPGGALHVVSRSSSIHRLVATAESGRRVFTLALTVPGLEVTKSVDCVGVMTITCAERGHDREIAYVVVMPAAAWAATDEKGGYLLSGVPPSSRIARAIQPEIGSAIDSVVVTPARATERDFYLIRADLSPVAPPGKE